MKLFTLAPMFIAGMLSTCGYPAPSQAQTMGLHMFSVHAHKYDAIGATNWNNNNPGAYIKWDNGVVVGTYYNSIRKQSSYVGYTIPLSDNIDVVVGAVTGYYGAVPSGTYGTKKVLPMVVPSVHFPLIDNMRGRVHFIPKTGKYAAAAVHFSIEASF